MIFHKVCIIKILLIVIFIVNFSFPQSSHNFQINIYSENILGGTFFKEIYKNSLGGNLSYNYGFENNLNIGILISYNPFNHFIKETEAKLSFINFQPEIGYKIYLLDNLIVFPKVSLGNSWFQLNGNFGNSQNLQPLKISGSGFSFTPNLTITQLFSENYGISFFTSYRFVANSSTISKGDSFEWFEIGGGIFYCF